MPVYSTLIALGALVLYFSFRSFTRTASHGGAALELLISGEALTGRYRAMERLLDETDWHFLASQPGFTPARIRKIRAQRRELFRRYLQSMSSDFSALCMLIRSLMVMSDSDRSDLSSKLTKIQAIFFVNLLLVHVRLGAHALGMESLRVDVSALTRTIEEIGSQVRALQLAANPSLA